MDSPLSPPSPRMSFLTLIPKNMITILAQADGGRDFFPLERKFQKKVMIMAHEIGGWSPSGG